MVKRFDHGLAWSSTGHRKNRPKFNRDKKGDNNHETHAVLTPGVYKLKIDARSLVQQIREDVTLNVGITLTINAMLKPCGASEPVVINAGAAPMVETSKTEIAGVVSGWAICSYDVSTN